MLPISNRHCIFETLLIYKIRQDKSCTSPFHYIRQIFQCQTDIRTTTFRFEINQFANNIKNMFTTFFRRYKFLYSIREKNNTYLIIVLNGRECQCCSNLGHHILFHLLNSTKLQTTGNIYHQHHCQFTFFLKHLNIRFVETRRYVPVDVANIITKLIFTHFGKCHTPTLESRMILACKNIVRQSACLCFDLTNFF